MLPELKRTENLEHTMKLIVGLIAIFLAALANYLSAVPLQSISAAYHEGGWARDIFVGFLFAISSFMIAYNGTTIPEMILTKIAAVMALGIAMFPCECEIHDQVIRHVHGISAGVMFAILFLLCCCYFWRAIRKPFPQSKIRAVIYAVCGIIILGSMLLVLIDHIKDGGISSKIPRLTFYCEKYALVFFGFAWLTASRIIPIITHKDERLSLSPFTGRADEFIDVKKRIEQFKSRRQK